MIILKLRRKRLRKILDDQKTSHSYGLIGRINIVKMAVLPNAFYRLSTITVKMPKQLSQNHIKVLKFLWNDKRPLINKTILSTNKNIYRITIADFKLYCRALFYCKTDM